NDFVALGHEECDISDLNRVLEIFENVKPDIVINCAAYNQVDKAEEDFATTVKVNSLGVRNLAFACKKFDAFLVHYSTDYVFDGKKEDGLYTEEDIPNPLNDYGKSKLLGEIFLNEETESYLIFRVSWVYGEGKQNFIYKLMHWAENNEYLKVAYDEISVPTSTRTIVEVTLKALDSGLTGLYHLINSGYASRYEWAKKVFEIKGINKFIKPVSSDFFNLPAKRPKFSAMDNSKISRELSLEIPKWDEELFKFLSAK
ncbi:dTDP-4-dehydrorhamnose reductase, partial [Persephonella sp.]